MKKLIVLCAVMLSLSAPALAEMKYVPDPVFQSLDPEESSPMEDMVVLAEDGDVRAQYILGDLYSKGKGGLPKDFKKSAEWFDLAAKNGYYESLVRLAALAKRQKKPVEAYRWYSLAGDYLSSGPWRKDALAEREALVKDAELTKEDLATARKAANLWKSDLRDYQEEQRRKKREAAKAEREKEKEEDKSKKEEKEKP